MKLLKKIAPLAIGVMIMAIPFTAALNIADWKGTFTSSTTAVVVGSGNIGTDDMAAALTVAKAVGIDTTTPSIVTGESYMFDKTNNHLNFGEGLDDIKATITDTQLPTVLADGIFTDEDQGDDFDYTQKIEIEGGIDLVHFSNDDYNDGEPTLGFELDDGATILTYTLDFVNNPEFSDEALDTTTIEMMGKIYYINDVADNETTLLDSGTAATIVQGESMTIGGKVVQIVGVYDTGDGYETVLTVDGVETKALEEGDTQKLGDNYVGIIDIRYDPKDSGKSSVKVSIGSGEILIQNGEEVEINGDAVDGLIGYINGGADVIEGTSDFESLTFEWTLDDDEFMATGDELVMPGLNSIKFMMSGMELPDSPEKIGIDVSSKKAQIKVELVSGEETLTLMESEAGATWDYLGAKKNSASTLVVEIDADAEMNLSKDNYFFATYLDGEDAETYYLKVIAIDEEDGVTIRDVIGNGECTSDEECDFGSLGVSFTIDDFDEDGENVTITAAENVYFDRLATVGGALFYLPNEDTSSDYYINLTNATDATTYDLYMFEQNEDGDVGEGSNISFTYSFSDNDRATVSDVDTFAWASAGNEMLDIDDDTEEGYVESVLGTKVIYHTGGDENDADVTYYGEEVYGKVYLAGTGATSNEGTTSWTAVRDSETTAYTSKNVIAIGGTAVNKVARKMLGLTDLDTPVYGREDAWATATGVDAIGKGILWIKPDVYTSNKYAMLVAGYEGADTEKTANFLTLGTLPASDKALLDTTGSVAVEVTA